MASLESVLKEMLQEELGIIGIAISDDAGNVLASTFSPKYLEKFEEGQATIATSMVAVFGAVEIAGSDFKLGEAEESLMVFKEGKLLLRRMSAGDKRLLLAIIASESVGLGFIRVFANRVAKKVREVV